MQIGAGGKCVTLMKTPVRARIVMSVAGMGRVVMETVVWVLVLVFVNVVVRSVVLTQMELPWVQQVQMEIL